MHFLHSTQIIVVSKSVWIQPTIFGSGSLTLLSVGSGYVVLEVPRFDHPLFQFVLVTKWCQVDYFLVTFGYILVKTLTNKICQWNPTGFRVFHNSFVLFDWSPDSKSFCFHFSLDYIWHTTDYMVIYGWYTTNTDRNDYENRFISEYWLLQSPIPTIC